MKMFEQTSSWPLGVLEGRQKWEHSQLHWSFTYKGKENRSILGAKSNEFFLIGSQEENNIPSLTSVHYMDFIGLFLTVALSLGQWWHNAKLQLIKTVLQENKPYGPDVWISPCVVYSNNGIFGIDRKTCTVFHSGNPLQIYVAQPSIWWVLSSTEFKVKIFYNHLGCSFISLLIKSWKCLSSSRERMGTEEGEPGVLTAFLNCGKIYIT